MEYISKIDLSRQVKVTKLTEQELNSVLLEGENIIYQNYDDELIFANKTNGVITEKALYPNKINGLDIPELPTTPPASGQAYVLGLIQNGSDLILKWVLTDTVFDYNDPTGTGSTTGITYSVTVTQPTGYIISGASLVGNGKIQINTMSSTLKAFSIDGGSGSTWSDPTTSPYYIFNNLGSAAESLEFDITVADGVSGNTLYTNTVLINKFPHAKFEICDHESEILSSFPEASNAYSITVTKIQDSYQGATGKIEIEVIDTQNDVLYAYAYGDIDDDPNNFLYTTPLTQNKYIFDGLSAGTHAVAVKKYIRNYVQITTAVINGISEQITPSWEYSLNTFDNFQAATNPTIIYYTANDVDHTIDETKYIYLRKVDLVYKATTIIAKQTPVPQTNSIIINSINSFSNIEPAGTLDAPYIVSGGTVNFSCKYNLTNYPPEAIMNIEYTNITTGASPDITSEQLNDMGGGVFENSMDVVDQFAPFVLGTNIIKYCFWMHNPDDPDGWSDYSDLYYFEYVIN